MEPINRYSLEDFTERYRADFDLHEPRPELWNALEKQLEADAATKARPPRMAIAAAEAAPLPPAAEVAAATPLTASYPAGARPARPAQLRAQPSAGRWQLVGMAAALAALVVAAGLGERWKSQQQELPTVAATHLTQGLSAEADEALYQHPGTALAVSADNGPDVDARLDTAVHGMERYYLAQLADRKTQLGQLAPEAAADWVHELVGLDSSYQQLKRELPSHPQPEVVLTAMNRNLQIRLDILDQQLQLHGVEAATTASNRASSEFVLADSRHEAGSLTAAR